MKPSNLVASIIICLLCFLLGLFINDVIEQEHCIAEEFIEGISCENLIIDFNESKVVSLVLDQFYKEQQEALK